MALGKYTHTHTDFLDKSSFKEPGIHQLAASVCLVQKVNKEDTMKSLNFKSSRDWSLLQKVRKQGAVLTEKIIYRI